MKKRFCFLITCITLLALVGCGEKETSKKEDIYYKEGSDIDIKGNVMGISKDEDKNIYALVDRNIIKKFDESGNIINELKLEIPKDKPIIPIAIGQDKNNIIYVEMKEFSKKSETHEIWKLDEKGKIKEKISIKKNDTGGFARFKFSRLYIRENNNFIYKNDNNNLIEVDKNGEIVNTLIGDNVEDFIKIENVIYGIIKNNENREIKLVKKILGSQGYEYSKKIDEDEFVGYLGYDTKEKKLLYTAGINSIKSFDLDGNLLKTVVDIENASLFRKIINVNGFAVSSKGNIYMSYMEQNENLKSPKTSIAVFNKKIGIRPESNKKVLTVGVNKKIDQMELKLLASEFMKKNPDIIVKFNNYDYKEEYLSDYFKKLNTKIISGKGEDLIPTEHLPMKKYALNGVFEKLNKFMKEDKEFKIDNYYKSIFDSLKVDGDYYAYPVKFKQSVLIGDNDLLKKNNINIEKGQWSRKDFIKALKDISKDEGLYGLSKITKIQLFNILFLGNSDEFIDYKNKDTNFNSEDFRKILKDVKLVFDENLLNEDMTKVEMTKSGKGTIGFINEDKLGMYNLTEIKNMINHFKLYPYPTKDGKGGYGFTVNAYGINANSKIKDIAWKFLKYLSSDKVNMDYYGFSMPVNKKEMKKILEKTKNSEKKVALYLEDSKWYSFPLTEEEIKNIQDSLENLTINTQLDPQVKNILTKSLNKYFNEGMGKEELIKTLDSRISTYLKE